MLENRENYYIYDPDVIMQRNIFNVNHSQISDENIDFHFNGILNILRDGIELDEVQNTFIHFYFADGIDVDLTIFDYFYNLIFWKLATIVDEPITSSYLFYPEDITKKEIKWYIDHLFIKKYRTKLEFIKLNNGIDDMIYKFKYINDFSLYLANTVNFEDTITLMNEYKEFYDAIHADLSGVPIEDVKEEGMKLARTQIKYIKNSNHCLRDSFRAAEAINPKQYKEVAANIGSKPDGTGGVFPTIINTSFITGGVNTPESYIIESSVGVIAQIIQKMNVGTSGAFARLLELNNIDTILHPDPDYSCNTRNFQEVLIDNDIKLNIYNMRYYKLNPKGPTYLLDSERDRHLIGQTIYFRSPMTCASFAKGQGICRKCYGDLYFINKDINIGKIAAELLSSDYTQKMLSAKHLLESLVIAMEWTEGFKDLFMLNFNTINLIEGIDYSGYRLSIPESSIMYEDEDDDMKYNEYITSFDIIYPNNVKVNFHTIDSDKIFISDDLDKYLQSPKALNSDGDIVINMELLRDMPIVFLMQIKNNELSKTLERSKAILNKNDETSKYDRDQILQEFVNTNLEGGINIDSIHMEVILSNQIRSVDDILDKPDWSIRDIPYNILTLGTSLTNNPSITVTLEYQKVSQTLISPLTSRKKKPSFLDIYFMKKPQDYLNDNVAISDDYQLSPDEEVNKHDAFTIMNNFIPDESECE